MFHMEDLFLKSYAILSIILSAAIDIDGENIVRLVSGCHG
jgi:hypothetical protein